MSHATVSFFVLCGLAGAIHTVAPDHWVPASILAWKRGWGRMRLSGFAVLVFALHVALGTAVFFAGEGILTRIPKSQFFGFSLAFVALIAVARGLRFSRVREVLRDGKQGVWGTFTVFSLLGPAESLVPVLIKAHHAGTGYATPIAFYYLGTLAAGTSLILFGRTAWNRPLLLTRGMGWASRRLAVMPVVAAVAVALGFLFRLAV